MLMIRNILRHTSYGPAIWDFCELIMPLDISKYRKYVDDFDLKEEQKVELLKTVWSIMESFVDKAFGKHPVQLCQKHHPEKDLQSPVKAVKSPQLSGIMRKKSASQSEQKNDSRKTKKEIGPHVEPS